MRLIYLYLLLALISSCTIPKRENDLTSLGLKGKVKSIYTRQFEAVEKFGKLEEGEELKGIYERGQVTYDEHGNKTFDWLGSYKHKYNNKGYLIETSSYNGTVLKTVVTLTYNHDGNKEEEIHRYGDGQLVYLIKYTYDRDNNLIETNSDQKEVRKKWKTTFNKGKEIEQDEYNYDGSLYLKTIYKYDDKGNKIEENSYTSSGKLFGYNGYTYDANGNLTEHHQILTFTNPSIPKDEFRKTYKYLEFDKEGNYIKYVYKYNENQPTITVRKIEYY